MWRDALLVMRKDLRIELRSRVIANQVAPFALLVLVLFAFALGPDRHFLAQSAPGLFWVTVLFAGLLAVQRSFAVEAPEGVADGLRISGLDPAGIFLGKLAAVALELATLEVVLVSGVLILYGGRVHGPGLLLTACIVGTIGFAAVGTLYGALSMAMRSRDSLLPLMLLPVVAPVLLAGTKVFQAALVHSSGGAGAWVRLLVVFAAVYSSIGVVLFGALTDAP